MNDFDKFCTDLLEQSKRFLEKSKDSTNDEGVKAYLNASLLLATCALEAYVNGLSQEICLSEKVPIHIKAVLLEKELKNDAGEFFLSDTLKISRLTDKIEIIYFRHTRKKLNGSITWWRNLKQGLDTRNKVTHPKEAVSLNETSVEEIITSVIESISALYLAVYKRKFPKSRLSLISKLSF